VKSLQVALLVLIAAILLWGSESVRSFPRRILAGTRPAPSARPPELAWHVHCWRLDEAGRESSESGNAQCDPRSAREGDGSGTAPL